LGDVGTFVGHRDHEGKGEALANSLSSPLRLCLLQYRARCSTAEFEGSGYDEWGDGSRHVGADGFRSNSTWLMGPSAKGGPCDGPRDQTELTFPGRTAGMRRSI
jgi:hypothetical protein